VDPGADDDRHLALEAVGHARSLLPDIRPAPAGVIPGDERPLEEPLSYKGSSRLLAPGGALRAM